MRRKKSTPHEWLEFELFDPYPEVVHGSFLRGSQGTLGFSHVACLRQEHKIVCHHIQEDLTVKTGDILITQRKGVALSIQHADCQAALLYDPVTCSIGALHAGWRGQVQGIYQEAIKQMGYHFGTKPENLCVAISPSLGPNHSEFIHYLQEWPSSFWEFRIGENYFDLWRIARWQLESAGVLKENIQLAGLCTYEDPASFHSYRRDKTRDQVLTTMIGLTC